MALTPEQLTGIRERTAETAKSYLLAGGQPSQMAQDREDLLAEVERLRCTDPIECGHEAALGQAQAQLAELQGQNTQTEVNFNNYAESAILQENELRAELAAARVDAEKWAAVEPTIRRAADHGHDAYIELMELAEPTTPAGEASGG